MTYRKLFTLILINNYIARRTARFLPDIMQKSLFFQRQMYQFKVLSMKQCLKCLQILSENFSFCITADLSILSGPLNMRSGQDRDHSIMLLYSVRSRELKETRMKWQRYCLTPSLHKLSKLCIPLHQFTTKWPSICPPYTQFLQFSHKEFNFCFRFLISTFSFEISLKIVFMGVVEIIVGNL